MKACPQCGAEYDDHVEYCFVDGSELSAGGPGPAGSAIPVAPRAAAAPPPPTSNRSMLPILLVLLFFGGLVVVGGLIAALTFFGPGSSTPTDPPPPVPTVRPDPVPVPDPVPEPPTELQVGFTSTPDSAEVWEGDTLLCVTPCTVAHPDIAPVPRQFVLKKRPHPDTPYEMQDPSTPQHVPLKPRPRPVRPRPTGAPKPDIVLER